MDPAGLFASEGWLVINKNSDLEKKAKINGVQRNGFKKG